jgi:hypothetical protein
LSAPSSSRRTYAEPWTQVEQIGVALGLLLFTERSPSSKYFDLRAIAADTLRMRPQSRRDVLDASDVRHNLKLGHWWEHLEIGLACRQPLLVPSESVCRWVEEHLARVAVDENLTVAQYDTEILQATHRRQSEPTSEDYHMRARFNPIQQEADRGGFAWMVSPAVSWTAIGA